MKIIDLHCDTISALRRARKKGEPASLRANSLHLDLERMKKGGYALQTFAAFVDLDEEEDPLAACREQIALFQEEMSVNREWIRPVTSYVEYEANQRDGFMSALLSLEEGAICRDKPELLRELYGLGARMMTLTWNHENGLGYPNHAELDVKGRLRTWPEEKGLKAAGFAMLEAMEDTGMLVDVSHLSDGGFWDVASASRRPFLASHSNARAVTNHVRNLTDPMIREIASRGGIIGINYCVAFLRPGWQPGDGRGSTRAEMVAHIRHIRNIGGMDCLALGSDYDGILEVPELEDCAAVPRLVETLAQEGFSTGEIEQLLYRNAERFFRENL
ncbi:dipeptidase [Hominifimenecus sp. rT4P-3]|uniref:dipeptidase n=1 Tax=Hominifimenecus sp. rT4P-3 TaxID=3242979 RepID=UPI003DA569AD